MYRLWPYVLDYGHGIYYISLFRLQLDTHEIVLLFRNVTLIQFLEAHQVFRNSTYSDAIKHHHLQTKSPTIPITHRTVKIDKF